ncbi:glycoside hydrolase family 3 N-terminal domain-containing protein [Streptomyces iakyrus]|uniref:glycoside hydrolase family 3 N-terminal domain-containing protein n=1 Tax=Streptomyces iakyrus TaxID=68219 RepID=UPI003D9113FD
MRSVMNSYADVDGIAVGASREVLTDLLRGVLGFDGFVSSDYATWTSWSNASGGGHPRRGGLPRDRGGPRRRDAQALRLRPGA